MKHIAIAAALLLGGCASNAAVQAAAEDFRTRIHNASAQDLYKSKRLAEFNHDAVAAHCWEVLGDFVARFGKAGPDELTIGAAQTVQVFLDSQNPTGIIRGACDPVRDRLVTIARNAVASYGISLIP